MPQLIIGLDSLDDDANYIHIDDAKEEKDYYCPCCKGLIKPRAFKKDNDYYVQPHFYHVNGGCSEETFIHFICKNWLFTVGCNFIVNGTKYEIKKVDTEKILETKFGKYRPDIIVETTTGKIFYFEIQVTNKKAQNYISKWDELGNDVVEVDTRYFINQKFKNNIPVFHLIYSNGECYIKSYTSKKYEKIIATRKIEWKRQDKLNYKIQWEKLDWFWKELSEYKQNNNKNGVLDAFNSLDISDRIWCYDNIKGKSCIDIKQDFAENISQFYYDSIECLNSKYQKYNISIFIEHKSALIYFLHIVWTANFNGYQVYDQYDIKCKGKKNIFIVNINYVEDEIHNFLLKCKENKEILDYINSFLSLPYISKIIPNQNCHNDENKFFSNLEFCIYYETYIHSKYVKEFIGREYYSNEYIPKERVESDYRMLKRKALNKLDNEFLTYALKNNRKYQDAISAISKICDQIPSLNIRISKYNDHITLLDNCTFIYEYEYQNSLFGTFEDEMKNTFLEHINYQKHLHDKIDSYVQLINSCSNSIWHASQQGNKLKLWLIDPVLHAGLCHRNIIFYDISNIEKEILFYMDSLLKYSQNYLEIRFMKLDD